MDDLQTLERRVASEVIRGMGPSEPVDDTAIFAAIRTTRSTEWRFRTMISATRFVAAAAIVALFGGFAIMGIVSIRQTDQLTPGAASPSPMATEALLSGMVTEEVEPGVLRILDDGAGHDLVTEPPVGLTVALDGSVWLLRRWQAFAWPGFDPRAGTADALFELGREETFPVEPVADRYRAELAVGADGAAWMNLGADTGADGSLASLDGSTWSYPTWPDGSTDVGAIEAAADGAIWLTQQKFDPASRVARIVDGEWTLLPPLTGPSLAGFFEGYGPGFDGRWAPGYLAAAADGTGWLAGGGHHSGRYRSDVVQTPAPVGLVHFDGTRWEAVDVPTGEVGDAWFAGPLALGSGGTLWVYYEKSHLPYDNDPRAGRLARLDADGWHLFTAQADGVPKLVQWYGAVASMAVDDDGTLWVGTPDYGGVLAFDGRDWRRYLDGLDVSRLAVAPDGSVFATALSGCHAHSPGTYECSSDDVDIGRAGLYVITPEATRTAGAGG